MKWVLILMLTSDGRPAAATVEFDTERACVTALVRIEKRWGSHYSICVPKGDLKE